MIDIDFSGQTVLVVGGSSGIGNGIARAFRDHGAEVHIWGTRALAADYDEEPGSVLSGLHYSCVDTTDQTALGSFTPAFERLNVLVLCQGTVVYQRGEFERPGWDKVMAVNLDSVFDCAMKFKPWLTASSGSMIIVSSLSGMRSNKGNPAYAASKAATINLTRTFGEAWAPEGVRVNGVAPGMVDTKLTKITTGHPQRLASILSAIPMGRLGDPAEIGGVALFLASPLASYIVGQTIIADGGLSNA